MGFNVKLASSSTFWSDVKIHATAESGEQIEGTIRVRFNRKTESEIAELISRRASSKADGQGLLDAAIVDGWEAVSDENGAMTFTAENFVRFCDLVPGAASAILTRYFSASRGIKAE